MSKKTSLMTYSAVLTLGLTAGILADLPASEVPPALAAACKAANAGCGVGDDDKTSALSVYHYVQQGENLVPVEPDSGESWTITAYWNTELAPCSEASEQASVDVDRTSSGWTLSNVVTTTNIIDIDVCGIDTCQDAQLDEHSYSYKLIVRVYDPRGCTGSYNLRQVVYAVSDVDDGYELDVEDCTLGSSVTFSDNVEGATDSTFTSSRCDYDCDVNGATVSLIYE